jgi:hypothetical protein
MNAFCQNILSSLRDEAMGWSCTVSSMYALCAKKKEKKRKTEKRKENEIKKEKRGEPFSYDHGPYNRSTRL